MPLFPGSPMEHGKDAIDTSDALDGAPLPDQATLLEDIIDVFRYVGQGYMQHGRYDVQTQGRQPPASSLLCRLMLRAT